MLRVHLFGGLAGSWGETPLPHIASTAARSLFAYLLIYRDRPHTRDLLAGTFWPELPDAAARRRLSQALWLIRKALEPHPILLTEGDTVQLNPDLPLWLDVDQFGRLAPGGTGRLDDQTRLPAHEPANLSELEAAVELYQGDLLAGYYDDWILTEQERLRELFLDALGRLVKGYKGRGEYERALLHARRLASEDPWREEIHREVMRLYHVLGRDNEALKQFDACRRILSEELEVEPSRETMALAREIAIHDLADRSGEAVLSALPKFSPVPGIMLLDDPEVPELPLVGREAERTRLLAHVEALFQGLGGVILVEGEAGVGKTHLLRAVASDAEWRGAEVLWAGGQESGVTTPYGPLLAALNGGLSPLRANQLAQIVEKVWLQALAALLPPLAAALPDLPPPPKLEPAQEQERLAAALAQLVAGWAQITPLLLVLEDLHWAGEDALDLLARLVPALGEHPVLLVGSYRSEEARAQTSTWQKIQALDRAGVRHRLALGGLDAATTGELIRRCLGMGSPAPLFASRLHQETQGNPLFVLETLRVLHGEGLLSRDQDGEWSTPWDETTDDYAELPLPRAVEQTIARRLATLPPALEQTIHLAAVLGERFDFGLLRAACEQDPPTLLAALRSLAQRRFVDETDQDYGFSHDKIRQVVYEGLNAPERSSLHHQAAEAFEALHPDRVATLAYHWTRAEVWDRAADYHRLAGDRARAVYANAEAAGHYSQALNALDRLPGSPGLTHAFDLRLAREAVYARQGERQAQAEDLAALEALANSLADDIRRAEVALRRARYGEATGNYAQAAEAAQAAVELARVAQNADLEAEGGLQWGGALLRLGNYEAAQVQLEQALVSAQRASLGRVEGNTLRVLGTVSYRQGDIPQAQAYIERSLAICRKAGHRQGESASLNNLGVVSEEQGHYEQARSCYEQSLRICRQIGHRWGESNALSNLGLLHYRQQNYKEARTCYERSLRTCREIGNQMGEGNALINMTLVHREEGDYLADMDCSQRALDIYRQIEYRLGESYALTSLGNVYCILGKYDQAGRYLEQSLDICRELGNRRNEVGTLSDLSLIAHRLGDDETALEHGRQAVRVAQELGGSRSQGGALTQMGHALAGLGRLDEAADAYRQASAIKRELGETHESAEALAGLAGLALRQECPAQALEYVARILDHLETSPLPGDEDPFWVYLTCYRVLQANHNPRATQVLHRACEQLEEHAAKIENEELRRSFLENVASHRELIVAYHELGVRQEAGRRTIRLPRAQAPTGRPLRDDEYVAVTWTVDAPEDEAIAPKVARRRHRILRLLAEAHAQGAAPRDKDLADALGVGLRTLRRDMAALRAEGHDLSTRGRLEKMATRSADRDNP